MRRLALAVALACVLLGAAHGGESHSTGAVVTPTPSPATVAGEIHTTAATVTGEIPSTGGTAPEESTTVLTIVLTVFSIVF